MADVIKFADHKNASVVQLDSLHLVSSRPHPVKREWHSRKDIRFACIRIEELDHALSIAVLVSVLSFSDFLGALVSKRRNLLAIQSQNLAIPQGHE